MSWKAYGIGLTIIVALSWLLPPRAPSDALANIPTLSPAEQHRRDLMLTNCITQQSEAMARPHGHTPWVYRSDALKWCQENLRY